MSKKRATPATLDPSVALRTELSELGRVIRRLEAHRWRRPPELRHPYATDLIRRAAQLIDEASVPLSDAETLERIVELRRRLTDLCATLDRAWTQTRMVYRNQIPAVQQYP